MDISPFMSWTAYYKPYTAQFMIVFLYYIEMFAKIHVIMLQVFTAMRRGTRSIVGPLLRLTPRFTCPALQQYRVWCSTTQVSSTYYILLCTSNVMPQSEKGATRDILMNVILITPQSVLLTLCNSDIEMCNKRGSEI